MRQREIARETSQSTTLVHAVLGIELETVGKKVQILTS